MSRRRLVFSAGGRSQGISSLTSNKPPRPWLCVSGTLLLCRKFSPVLSSPSLFPVAPSYVPTNDSPGLLSLCFFIHEDERRSLGVQALFNVPRKGRERVFVRQTAGLEEHHHRRPRQQLHPRLRSSRNKGKAKGHRVLCPSVRYKRFVNSSVAFVFSNWHRCGEHLSQVARWNFLWEVCLVPRQRWLDEAPVTQILGSIRSAVGGRRHCPLDRMLCLFTIVRIRVRTIKIYTKHLF